VLKIGSFKAEEGEGKENFWDRKNPGLKDGFNEDSRLKKCQNIIIGFDLNNLIFFKKKYHYHQMLYFELSNYFVTDAFTLSLFNKKKAQTFYKCVIIITYILQ